MPNPPTRSPMPTKTSAKKPAAKHRVSPSSAKGGPKIQGQPDQPALDPVTAAQDTILISPTLLAALIARSIRLEMAPLVAELRDIAQTTHAASDRLFGESLKAKAHDEWKKNMGAAFDQSNATLSAAKEAVQERAKSLFGNVDWEEIAEKVAAWEQNPSRPKTATEVTMNSQAEESRRLQGLMDKLWAQGYRPLSTEPLVCRSFHKFEALISC